MASAVFGKYQVRRELGRGAMGVVYEARDPALGADVALKVMTVSPTASEESRSRQVERFCREAQSLAQLSHPHVVRLLEQGEAAGRPYFAMELVRGTTLRDRIQFQGPLSVAELTRLALELCDALDHLQLRGVVHRDLKPENIMLLPDGSAKLMDFSVARLVLEQSTAASSAFQGSPAYMSPEQVAGLPVDGRSDIYSLAITLYEAATGRRAVEGDSIVNIAHRVTSEYPSPPPGLPVPLQAVLMRALVKDPARRYARASEMAEDIRHGRLPNPPSASGAVNLSYPEAPPAYLGAEDVAPPAPVAAPLPRLPSAEETTLMSPPAPGEPPRAPCRLHPAIGGVASCSRCGYPVCYTCLLEVPGGGIICRACAFGPRQG
jgi:serine/threonine-protein kinase